MYSINYLNLLICIKKPFSCYILKKNKLFINFDFIFKRKKNIILSLIFIAIIKVVIHYTIYPDKVFGRKVKIITEIGYYINNIFERNLNLFMPSTIIVLLIAWFFNDKIKAR